MKLKIAAVVLGAFLALGVAAPVFAQTRPGSAPPSEGGGQQFEIIAPPAAARDATRPRESDFYREDIRTRHEPAFIEPLTGTVGGRKAGLSGWTAPPGQGDKTVQREVGGWFALGFTFIWDSPAPPAGSPPARR